jgi:hypothetical protein
MTNQRAKATVLRDTRIAMLSISSLHFEFITPSFFKLRLCPCGPFAWFPCEIDFFHAVLREIPSANFSSNNPTNFHQDQEAREERGPWHGGLCHLPSARHWLCPEVRIRVKKGPAVSGAGLVGLTPFARMSRRAYPAAGTSLLDDRSASLAALPRRGDDSRIRVRNGPNVIAFV